MKTKLDEISIHQTYYDEILTSLKKDRYAEYLGIEITDFQAGSATVQLKVEEHMLNAHATLHGGVLYSLADFAFALACNSYGRTAVGLSTTTNFITSARAGDIVIARAIEEKRNHRIGFYRIEVEANNEIIGTVEAICYRKSAYFINIE